MCKIYRQCFERLCTARLPELTNALPQPATSHTYGRSPVCVRLCKVRLLECQLYEYKSQIGQYQQMHGVIEQQFKKNEKQLKDLKKMNKQKESELSNMNLMLRGRPSLRNSLTRT